MRIIFARIFRHNGGGAQGKARLGAATQFWHVATAGQGGTSRRALRRPAAATILSWRTRQAAGDAVEAGADKRSDLLRELMAVFDDLPAALRDAINYAPEPLDPKDLATLCRRHGAANVLAMIEMKLRRRARAAMPERKPD